MSVSFFKTGEPPQRARAIGVSLALGYFYCEDVDETRRQLNFSIGFWWAIFQWQLWRAKS